MDVPGSRNIRFYGVVRYFKSETTGLLFQMSGIGMVRGDECNLPRNGLHLIILKRQIHIPEISRPFMP